jgi:hypothetical protein
MAGAALTTAELMAIIAMLQVQVDALTAAAPVATAAPPAGTAPVVFADMSQMLGANYLIDYSTKRVSAIFEQGCKALNSKTLTNGFAMTPNQTVTLLKPSTVVSLQWAGIRAQGRLPHSPTALDVKSTSSRATVISTRPLSKLRVRDFASLGSLTPRLAQNKTTQ